MRVIFNNASVFDGTSVASRLGTVVVEDDRIASVSSDQGPPPNPGDRVVDLDGMTLMPGMTMGHWHGDYRGLSLGELGKLYLGMEKPPSYMAAIAATSLQTVLQSGFTAVVGAGCSHDIDASMKLAIAEGVFDGPHILAAGHHINTTSGDNDRAKWWYNLRPAYENGVAVIGAEIFCDGPEAARHAVRREISRGVEVIKIFPTGGHGIEINPERREIAPDELRAIIDTAHDRGAIVRGHVSGAKAILECIEAGMDIVDHGDGMDERCIDAMLKHGTFLVPSMLFLKILLTTPMGVPEHLLRPVRKDFDHMVKWVPIANKAGVKIIPGDDYGLDFMPHRLGIYAEDMAIHVEDSGVDPADVLRWTTLNGAALTRRAGETGEIKAGYRADLLVVDGDPTKDLTLLQNPAENLKMIMVGGKLAKDDMPAAQTSRSKSGGRVLQAAAG